MSYDFDISQFNDPAAGITKADFTEQVLKKVAGVKLMPEMPQ